jgi:hypothetical protein
MGGLIGKADAQFHLIARDMSMSPLHYNVDLAALD